MNVTRNKPIHVRTILHRENRPYKPGPRGYIGKHREGVKEVTPHDEKAIA